MEAENVTNGLLSADDLYFLRENLEAEPAPPEGDPQAQRVYTVESNVTDLDSPVWIRDRVLSEVRSMAADRGLQVKVKFRELRQEAFAGSRGGTIFLPEERGYPPYRFLNDGEYLAATIVHEFAHIVTVGKYWKQKIQSHGPEFVRCYLDILSTVMPIGRMEEAMAFLGVRVAPRTCA